MESTYPIAVFLSTEELEKLECLKILYGERCPIGRLIAKEFDLCIEDGSIGEAEEENAV